MRVYKFRVWQTEYKDMVYFDLTNAECYALDGEIMQFTGLKDRKGKEIFENDILSMNKGQYYSIVVWDENMTGWKAEHKSSGYESITAFLEEHEVVGNIYENPQLLELQKS